jgi:outer membrane lipoprotein-sorting protein
MKIILKLIVTLLLSTSSLFIYAENTDSLLQTIISGIEANYAPIKKAEFVLVAEQTSSQGNKEFTSITTVSVCGDSIRYDSEVNNNKSILVFDDGKWWQPTYMGNQKRIIVDAKGTLNSRPIPDPRETFVRDRDERLVDYLNRVDVADTKIIQQDGNELIEITFSEKGEVEDSDGKKHKSTRGKIMTFDPLKSFLPISEILVYDNKPAYSITYDYQNVSTPSLWLLSKSTSKSTSSSDLSSVVTTLTKFNFNPDFDKSFFEFPRIIEDGTYVDDHISGAYIHGQESSLELPATRGSLIKTLLIILGLIMVAIGIYYKVQKQKSLE